MLEKRNTILKKSYKVVVKIFSGQVMKNLNLLRQDVEWLEKHFSLDKSERDDIPQPSQFNKGTTWNS